MRADRSESRSCLSVRAWTFTHDHAHRDVRDLDPRLGVCAGSRPPSPCRPGWCPGRWGLGGRAGLDAAENGDDHALDGEVVGGDQLRELRVFRLEVGFAFFSQVALEGGFAIDQRRNDVPLAR